MLRPDQEDQQHEQDQVQVDEQDQDGVGAQRPAAGELRQSGLEEREGHHRQRREKDDEALASAAARVGRWRALERRPLERGLVGRVRHAGRDDRGRREGRQPGGCALST